MNNSSGEKGRNMFRPFTHKSLENEEEHLSKKRTMHTDHATKTEEELSFEEQDSKPDESLKQKSLLPSWLREDFPRELANNPLEDVDPFYKNRKTFIVITKEHYLLRFDATKAFWLLGPFNPIRRVAIFTLAHSLFALLIVAVILATCLVMVMPKTPTIQTILLAFNVIYTMEVIVKVTARGFILRPFTYLRDPWNWLDFVLTFLAYTPIGPDVGGFAALRGLRLLELLAYIKFTHDMGIMSRTIKESLINLASVLIFLAFFVFVFALSGLLHFMGILTSKCIPNFPVNGSWGDLTDENWANFVSNSTNWVMDGYATPLCRNTSGSGPCKEGYTCLEGYGTNPNYGYTNFNTLGWASLSTFQVLTQDYWENLYHMVLRTGGPWQSLFFIFAIFYASYYLQALILAVVATTYGEVKRRAEVDEAVAGEKTQHATQTGQEVSSNGDNLYFRHGLVKTYSDAQRRFPYVDDSQATTPVTTPIIEEDFAKISSTFNNAANDVNQKSPSQRSKLDFLCVWDCFSPWEKFRQIVSLIIFEPFVVIFLAFCIIVDIFLMSLYHHDMSNNLEITLYSANYFFTITFAIEVIMKIIAMHPKYYFQENWNVLEFAVITTSVMELSLGRAMVLSVLRTFRLLRLIKSAQLQIWPTLNWLLSVMEATLPALMSLTTVLLIILNVVATIGMYLFGRNYIDNVVRFPDSEIPRWNFTDFLHSYMLVFRALCGEWIESMWDCMLVGDVTCIPFFLFIVLILRFVIFNLFSALLLINFGPINPKCAQGSDDKVQQALTGLNRGITWIKSKQSKLTDQIQSTTEGQEVRYVGINLINKLNTATDDIKLDEQSNNLINLAEDDNKGDSGIEASNPVKEMASQTEKKSASLNEELPRSGSFRFRLYQLVENKYFEIAIGVMIVISSVALALEDVHLQSRPKLQHILYFMDIVITVAFLLEMLLRWLGLGLCKYFKRPLCLLDFVVVLCCLIHLIAPFFGFYTLRVLKTVRILRLLRTIQRKKGMEIVINTLTKAIPSICCVLILCVIIWLTFAILGVRLFAGKYFKCVDANEMVMNFEVIPDSDACLAENYTWKNSDMNLDHLGNAYLSLLQVATFKGWIEIMNDATDSRQLHRQPIRETNIYMYLYFQIFIVICSFFALTMFIGVVLDSYNKQRSKANGDIEFWMTQDQKQYYSALSKIDSRKPVKAIPRPKWTLLAKLYATVQSKEFEMIFMLIIGLNMLALAMDHYQLNESFAKALDYVTLIFLAIFTVECLLKMLAFRHHYFKDSWNVFDLTIIVLSMLAMPWPKYVPNVVTLSLLRIIRVIKIGRLLRQINCAKNIRGLLSAATACFPALTNIALLLFVITFIFSIFGMSFFMHVKEKGILDDLFNFRTFGQSVLILIPVATLAGWDGVLSAITNEVNCELGEQGNCGNFTLGTAFLLSYLLITYLITVMYIPVVFWHYAKTKEDAEEGVTEDDCDMFFETWQQFDPDATNYIQYEQLSDFLSALETPFQIRKPNKLKITALDVPTCRNDRIFFVDVFCAVLDDFFARKDDKCCKNLCAAQMQTGEPGYETISSTLQRQRERHMVRNLWRKQNQYSGSSDDDKELREHQTSVEIETDGFTFKNGRK